VAIRVERDCNLLSTGLATSAYSSPESKPITLKIITSAGDVPAYGGMRLWLPVPEARGAEIGPWVLALRLERFAFGIRGEVQLVKVFEMNRVDDNDAFVQLVHE